MQETFEIRLDYVAFNQYVYFNAIKHNLNFLSCIDHCILFGVFLRALANCRYKVILSANLVQPGSNAATPT